jgi:hypothetical protein
VGGGTAPSTSSGGNSFNLTSGQTTGTFDPSLKPDALPNDTSFFGNIKSGINNVADTLGVKPGSLLGAGVSGLGLVKDLATGNSAGNIKGYNELSSQAGALAGQGAQLLSYETNGTLPAGAQANVDQAVAAAQAAIRSKYASMGISGSSAEIQELNQVKQNAVAQQFQIANQLATQGLSQTNTSAEIYKQLLASNQKQAEATSAAVGNLASALASPVSTKTTNNPGALAA